MILAFFWPLLFSFRHGAVSAQVFFPAHGFTTVTADTSFAAPPALSIVNAAGALLLRVQYDLGANLTEEQRRDSPVPDTMGFRVVNSADVGPVVVAAAGAPGGSDASFETVFVGEIGGSLRDLLPDHPKTSIQDAVCLGRFGRGRRLGVVVAKFIWGQEIHYAPHRYDVWLYLWSGHAFELSSHRRTTRRHQSFRGALAEVGFRCRYDFRRALLPDF